MSATARFEDISDEGFLQLIENRDSSNTKNVIKGAMRSVSAYCDSQWIPTADFESSNEKLEFLCRTQNTEERIS